MQKKHLNCLSIFLRFYVLAFLVFVTTSVSAQPELVMDIDYYLDGKLLTDKRDARSTAMIGELRRMTMQKVNEPISKYKIRKSIEKIYSLGDFSQIEVTSTPLTEGDGWKSGVRLNFWLKSKTVIKEVKVTGNRHVSRKEILSAIKSKPEGEYLKSTVRDDLRKIKDVYRKHGYFQLEAKLTQAKIYKNGKIFLKFFIMEETRATLRLIKFVGNSAISNKRLLKEMKTDGDTGYDYEILEEDIDRLKALYRDSGYMTVEFEEPKLAYDLNEDAIDITIRIHEGAKLVVDFVGDDVDKKELIEKIALYRRNSYSGFTLQKSAVEIENFYKEKGFYNAKVDYKLEESPEKAEVTFNIDKGKLLTIAKIFFEGNDRFDTGVLKENVETKASSRWALPGLRWLFHRGLFDKNQFENDLRAIKIFYKQHGYREVRVDYEKPIEIRDDRMHIKIQIREGSQTLIDQVELHGNEFFRSEDLSERLTASAGKPYNGEWVSRDVAYLRSLYDKNGYVYAQIKPAFLSGNLVYYINEGKQTKIGELDFWGNKKTVDSVLSREFISLGIDSGKVLNLDKLYQCQQRLYALGLFETVRFDIPKRLESKEVLDIDVMVKEHNPGIINVSGGYSPSEGIRGTLEVGYNNLYGRAIRLGSKLRIGTRGNLYEGRLIEPYFFYTRTQLTLRAFRDDLKEKENIIATGGTVNLAKSITLHNNISLEYKYQDLRSRQYELKTVVSSVSVGFNRDTRNHFLSPSSGFLHNIVFEYAGGLLSGETSFAKFTTTDKYYRSIKGNTILALALRTGYEEGLRSYRKKEIISFERFSAGGSTTVRGYADRSLGPLDDFGNHRGDAMFIFNAELRFPVYKWFRGVAFFDSGNVWDKLRFSDIKDDPLKCAAGLGIRVDTPIGPVRIDYGYPLSRIEDKGIPGEFYFALGHAF